MVVNGDEIFGTTNVELAFVGACMSNEDLLDETRITEDDFENPVYGILFSRMVERHKAGRGVSQSLLSEDFPDHVRVIWSSTDSLSELAKASSHERTILDRSVRRRLRAAAIRITAMSNGLDLDVDACRAEIDAAVVSETITLKSMKQDAVEILAGHRKHVQTVPSPWLELNNIIGGFGPGRMYVIGARPGVGKSAVASQIAYELAGHGPVVFATMEMDKGEVYSRIVSQQAEIYYGGMRNMSEYMAARERLWLVERNRDIRVLDSGTQTVAGIRSAVRSASRDGQVAGVVVDYIHLLSTPTPIENETNRIGELTRSLKQLSMDFKVPVIALSQLNREVASRESARPGLRDLRGSGSIEQDADAVIFLYREDSYEEVNKILSVYVAKNRQGPAFVGFELNWQGEFVRAVSA